MLVLVGMMLMTALGLVVVLLATADTLASANQRDATVALYAAESMLEQAAAELVGQPDWDAVLSGAAVSAYADGPPAGDRGLAGGGTVNLEQLANLANCGSPPGCTAAARQAVTASRPWGLNNPFWRPYRYGPVDGLGPASASYVVVLVADDPAETDGDPERDGVGPNPGARVLLLRAEAFGPKGARRRLEVTMAGVTVPGGGQAPRFLSWKEVR